MKNLTQATLLLTLSLATSAHAGAISSVYTDLNFKKCKTLMSDAESGSVSYLCKGFAGMPVNYLEGDLRGYISFGKKPNDQCSTMQTFSDFNSPGPRIEWRLNGGKPVATILRWTTQSGDDGLTKKSWLVVSKLESTNSCRAALIDGAMPDANKLAQQKADSLGNFNCVKDTPEVISKSKVKIDELMSGAPCGSGPYR